MLYGNLTDEISLNMLVEKNCGKELICLNLYFSKTAFPPLFYVVLLCFSFSVGSPYELQCIPLSSAIQLLFSLMFFLPSLGVESRCMASAAIRMYSCSPCWVKSFNFLISSFQIISISFSCLKSCSPKFTVNFQNSENSHESSVKGFEFNYTAVGITQRFNDTIM